MNKKARDIKDIIQPGWKVDKIKLEVKYRKIEEVQAIAWELSNDNYVIEQYESKQLKKCAKNYKIEKPGGIVYIGIGKNSHQGNWRENQKSLIIEFNPQKVNPFNEIEYLKHIKKMDKHRIGIMSLDLAYDIYCNIKELELHHRHGNEKYGEFGVNGQVETKYLGAMGNNHVKLYNKARELNKTTTEENITEDGEVKENNVKIQGECTRFEITIKIPEKERISFILGLTPFTIQEMIDLPKLTPVANKSKIEEIMDSYKGNDYSNLLTVHFGKIEKLNDRAKKKYKEMYQGIKNSSLDTTSKELQAKLSNFNYDNIYNTIYTYISQTFKGQSKLKLTQEI